MLLDITDETAISVDVPDAVDRVGGLDVLVNNAGYSLIGAIEETSATEAEEIMAVNFFGPMRLTQTVLPYFRRQHGGHVVNVSSLAGTIGFPWSAMYSASKSALAAWSDALAAETASLRRQGHLSRAGRPPHQLRLVEPAGLSARRFRSTPSRSPR